MSRRLEQRFGPLEPPRATDPLDELIWTVLSQHTSDLNAERAFHALRAAYPTWETVVAAKPSAVADTIRSGGLANTKAVRIQAILREIAEREGGYDLSRLLEMTDAPAREYLTALPGVGPKTAAVVMAFALGRDAIPVDTHVHRVSRRLGLIRLGRELCKATGPRCEECPLADLCPTAPSVLGFTPRRRR